MELPLLSPRRSTVALLACLAFSFIFIAAAPARSGPPVPGAVKLKSKNLKKVGKVRCGRIHGKWWPGTRFRHNYFVTHSRQSKNYARRARQAHGAARNSYRRKAAAFSKKAKAQLPTCRRHKATTSPTPTTKPTLPAPTATTQPLRFSLSGAAGLALSSSTPTRAATRQASTSSNLQVVTSTGDVAPATASGSATFRQFRIGPDGKVYVVFAQRVNLDNTAAFTSSGCLLAQVDPATGVPTCIDSSLGYIGTSGINSASANPWIQFDASGAMYYAGHATDNKTVLRKYAGGTITDLVNDNITVDDFLVLPDGSVLVNGVTDATHSSWVRRITPQGGLQQLTTSTSQFMRVFPDGNVYMGLWGSDPSQVDNFGVKRFLTQSNQLEAKYWITSDMNGTVRDGYFKAEDFCSGTDWNARSSFCGTDGAVTNGLFPTSNGSMYAVAGGNQQQGLLTEYYPTLAFPPTDVTDIKVAQGAGTNLVLAGLNATHQNVMVVHNTTNDAETQLIGPDNEIEIYHVNYVASANKVMFDGLRFADNKYVLGEVDLASGQLSVSATLGAKWADFQTF